MTREGRFPAALLALCIATLTFAGVAHAAPGWTPKETLPDPKLAGYVLAAVAGPDGTTTVVFTQTQNGHSAIVAVERPPGGRLGAPVTLSAAPDDECTLPVVSVNKRGDVIVVWQRLGGTTYRVESAFRPAGGAWQPAVGVTSDTHTAEM